MITIQTISTLLGFVVGPRFQVSIATDQVPYKYTYKNTGGSATCIIMNILNELLKGEQISITLLVFRQNLKSRRDVFRLTSQIYACITNSVANHKVLVHWYNAF